MVKWTTGILLVACAGLGATVVVQRSSMRRLRDDLKDMDRRISRVEARQKEPVASQAAVEELRTEVARVEKKVLQAPAAAPAPRPSPDALPTFVTEEDIGKIVDAKVEEKLQARGEKNPGDGERKMPLHDLSKEIEIPPALQPKVAQAADAAKKEIFDLLKTIRPDGTNLADDLLDVMVKGDTEGAKRVFGRLFSEKVPATDTTYVGAVASIRDKARAELQRTMGAEIFARYQHTNVHPENIETGFDPWADYLKERGPR